MFLVHPLLIISYSWNTHFTWGQSYLHFKIKVLQYFAYKVQFSGSRNIVDTFVIPLDISLVQKLFFLLWNYIYRKSNDTLKGLVIIFERNWNLKCQREFIPIAPQYISVKKDQVVLSVIKENITVFWPTARQWITVLPFCSTICSNFYLRLRKASCWTSWMRWSS